MLNIKLITVGNLKETYLRDAAAEYTKRLGGLCRFETVQLKEAYLPNSPSRSEIEAALDSEGARILAQMPPRAYKIAMCVEGKQCSSEEFAKKLENISAATSDICFVIGSSYGISPRVKDVCDMRMSVSMLTFPHQLMRVILLEVIYRALNIIKGTKYHK